MLSTFKTGEDWGRVGRLAANKALWIRGPTRVESLSEFTINGSSFTSFTELLVLAVIIQAAPHMFQKDGLKRALFFF